MHDGANSKAIQKEEDWPVHAPIFLTIFNENFRFRDENK
jgi:hypothetical protein